MAFRDTWKRMNWLAFAGIATALYAIAVGYTLGWSRTWSFLTTEPDLNEVGDFLAGLLAPLALVWLIAAVLTQRQELNETRDQFIENQKVVDAQLKTINAQNALLSLQHNQSVENAKQAYRLSLFDKRFAIYQTFIKFDEAHTGKDYRDESYWAMTNLAQESGFVFDRSIEEWFEAIAQQIHDYIQFKSLNPYKNLNFSLLGEERDTFDEYNRNLEKQYAEYTDWIKEQFLPEVRIGKFWHFLHVSDQPYIEG